jgi:CheY-like chemotaxis protein
VDDDTDAVELLRTVFEGAGADVTVARSAAEAVHQLSSRPIDVLVSDIGMPGEDGYELLRRLRATGSTNARVPAIALSAYTGADYRRRAREVGFQEYLPKPVDVSQIVDVVARLAEEQREQRSG